MSARRSERFASDPQWRPRVSVAIPVYNRAHSIGRCIESVLASDYPPDRREVIVVDNASNDGTDAVIAGFGARIKAVRETKRGVAAARNAGMRAATGEVLAYTDSDCVVDPHWLSRLVPPLQDPWVGGVGGRILADPAGKDIEHFGERIHDHDKAINRLRPGYLITMNTAFRLDVIRSLGGFDERLYRGEDVDLAYRLLHAGYTLCYAAEATVYHSNRGTVAELLAEAYRHGYYGVELVRMHADFLDQMSAGGDRRLANGGSAYTRALPARREALYWAMFRAAKMVGGAMGYLRAYRRHGRV